MDLKSAAAEILEPLGYEVLELTISSSGRSRKVLLRVDRLDGQVVSIDDVAKAAEVFGLELDRLDPFPTPYRLEVESPGSERPLVTPRHFQRFSGLLVKFRVGGETARGRIVSVAGDDVTFDVAGAHKTVRVSDLEMARLAEWPDTPR